MKPRLRELVCEIYMENMLRVGDSKLEVTYTEKCWYYGACMMDCPAEAVRLDLPLLMRPVTKRVKE